MSSILGWRTEKQDSDLALGRFIFCGMRCPELLRLVFSPLLRVSSWESGPSSRCVLRPRLQSVYIQKTDFGTELGCHERAYWGESSMFCPSPSAREEYGNPEDPGPGHWGVRKSSISFSETCARARLRLRICGYLSRGLHATGMPQLRFAAQSCKDGREQYASSHEDVEGLTFHGILLSGG
jgi:hypothetical protein